MPSQEASTLTLNDVHRLSKLEMQPQGNFTDFLSLEPLTEFEHQDIVRHTRGLLATYAIADGDFTASRLPLAQIYGKLLSC